MSLTYKIKTTKYLTEVFLGKALPKHMLLHCIIQLMIMTVHLLLVEISPSALPQTNSHDINFWVTNQIKLGAAVTTTYNIRIIY